MNIAKRSIWGEGDVHCDELIQKLHEFTNICISKAPDVSHLFSSMEKLGVPLSTSSSSSPKNFKSKDNNISQYKKSQSPKPIQPRSEQTGTTPLDEQLKCQQNSVNLNSANLLKKEVVALQNVNNNSIQNYYPDLTQERQISELSQNGIHPFETIADAVTKVCGGWSMFVFNFIIIRRDLVKAFRK